MPRVFFPPPREEKEEDCEQKAATKWAEELHQKGDFQVNEEKTCVSFGDGLYYMLDA